ncbi:galactosyltransferase-related protein [Dyadobacter sp. CY345]|uniref:glycosyltransferase family 2 protein n=1 Tax=Dyadobacter sp. CY345 TaxID=2909335 RepID=UPI001F1DD24D|nr:glycosyltransferase [Dyadobacter sp. CY345]MCF2442598.1 galactosyltransferase-related protein [Dyadobacter sp. CY345]
MSEFSIVTIIKGRRKQLANLLESVKASTIHPYDIQVVCMDNLNGLTTPDGLNVNTHLINEIHELPLAAARNLGIAAAKTDNVIFIDVDCIVSPTLFANLLMVLDSANIITAYPLYLPVLPEAGNYGDLKHKAVTHPSRKRIPAGQPVEHLLFWSLIFAIQKQTFEKIGGFDESFIGYGAEDTDFAMMFHKAAVKLMFINDHVLHQYHDKYDPPVNHFLSIIENATRYHQKWGVLPMQRWLKAFAELGLINIDQAYNISVIQKPTDSQIKNSVSPYPY